jgi:hypothetical protein
MPMLSPVICKKCGHASIEPVPMTLGNSKVTFVGTTVSVAGSCCTKCGGPWVIPDGEYTGDTITFFRSDQFRAVVDALNSLRGMAERGASVDDISETIDREYPFAESLKRCLPDGLKAFAGLCALLTVLLSRCSRDESPPTIQTNNHGIFVNGDVNGVLSGISEKLNCDQPSSPTEKEAGLMPRKAK